LQRGVRRASYFKRPRPLEDLALELQGAPGQFIQTIAGQHWCAVDVRLDAFCGVHHIRRRHGEIGWQRLRRDVDVAPPDDSDGCGDARDGAGQQVPLLHFAGHFCRRLFNV